MWETRPPLKTKVLQIIDDLMFVGRTPIPMPSGTPVGDAQRFSTTYREAVGLGGAGRRRFALLNAFIDFALRERGRAELCAWLILYRHAKPDDTVTASVADLARRAGCTPRTMQTALKRLRSRRLLRRLERGTLAGGPSIWRLATPEPDGTTGRILPVTTGTELPV
ncbi:MAG: hypothetical protein HY763_14925 [Planctomycetes bacterium]|nr:hypothetical protein [Planctomycetota bacterium]